MEELIRQAFLHVDVIGQHVAEGHYDLVGPNGDIILPQVWQTVIEPDWSITMHMWPIPEKPKEPEPPVVVEPEPAVVPVPEPANVAEAAAGMSSPLCLSGPLPLPPVSTTKTRTILGDPPPPPPPPQPKKPRPPPNPGAFALWMTGGRPKPGRSLKAGKKLEVI